MYIPESQMTSCLFPLGRLRAVVMRKVVPSRSGNSIACVPMSHHVGIYFIVLRRLGHGCSVFMLAVWLMLGLMAIARNTDPKTME